MYWIDKYREGYFDLESPPSDYPVGLHRWIVADKPAAFKLVGCSEHYHEMMLLAQQLEDEV